MSVTWQSDTPPETPKISPLGWILVVVRGVPLILVLATGLVLTGLLRLIERPLFGARRPVTPYITQCVCLLALMLMGITCRVNGQVPKKALALVANHSSWLDIFALNACDRFYFVSKSEVASWPGIGWLARATGTVFIRRRGVEARSQTQVLADRIALGHKLCLFPEGTSTDGMRVLSFKSTPFAALFRDSISSDALVQPVSVIYHAPSGAEPRFYGWWGDMGFGPHLIKLLARPGQGRIQVMFHAPHKLSDYKDRKALAKALEGVVRQGLSDGFASAIGSAPSAS